MVIFSLNQFLRRKSFTNFAYLVVLFLGLIGDNIHRDYGKAIVPMNILKLKPRSSMI